MIAVLGIFAVLGVIIYLINMHANYHWFSGDTNFCMEYSYKKIPINGYELPRFTFKQFLNFYQLNPRKWEVLDNNDLDWYGIPARRENGNYYPIFFTNMFEYNKYRRWAKKLSKQTRKEEHNKEQYAATKKIVSIVQKDIDTIRKEYENNLIETENTLTTVLDNLKKENVE